MRVPRALPLVLLLTLAWPTPLGAQPPAPAPASLRPTGQAELSFVATSGNTDTRTLGLAGEVELIVDGWTLEARSAFVSGSADNAITARSVSAQLRGARRLSDRLETFAQFDYARNRFAGILDRYTADGGLRVRLSPPEGRHQLRLLLGGGYTRELRVASKEQAFASANYGASYRSRLSGTSELSADAQLTHDVGRAANWRGATTISVTAQITAALSMKLSSRLSRLNEPVPGFGRSDVLTSAAVVATF
jgi:putative salt-induced outer membrane protein YdiY